VRMGAICRGGLDGMAGDPRCETVKISVVIVELQADRTGFGHGLSPSLGGMRLQTQTAFVLVRRAKN